MSTNYESTTGQGNILPEGEKTFVRAAKSIDLRTEEFDPIFDMLFDRLNDLQFSQEPGLRRQRFVLAVDEPTIIPRDVILSADKPVRYLPAGKLDLKIDTTAEGIQDISFRGSTQSQDDVYVIKQAMNNTWEILIDTDDSTVESIYLSEAELLTLVERAVVDQDPDGEFHLGWRDRAQIAGNPNAVGEYLAEIAEKFSVYSEQEAVYSSELNPSITNPIINCAYVIKQPLTLDATGYAEEVFAIKEPHYFVTKEDGSLGTVQRIMTVSRKPSSTNGNASRFTAHALLRGDISQEGLNHIRDAEDNLRLAKVAAKSMASFADERLDQAA